MLVNVALNVPVVHIGRDLIIAKDGAILESGDLWSRDAYNMVYSVDKGHYPSNLTDGREDTRAYPAHWYFDYIVDLGRVYEIQEIKLVWGEYADPKYVTNWNLYKQEALGNNWNRAWSGGEPCSEHTLEMDITAMRLRVSAESVRDGKVLNWIGIYGLEAWAEELA